MTKGGSVKWCHERSGAMKRVPLSGGGGSMKGRFCEGGGSMKGVL